MHSLSLWARAVPAPTLGKASRYAWQKPLCVERLSLQCRSSQSICQRGTRTFKRKAQRLLSSDSSSGTPGTQNNDAAAAHLTLKGAADETKLSWEAVRALFVASAVPMVGFGFMDNLVMIQAGQYIDSTLGVKLGLATMTAAACGQIVSDVSGVLFGGTLEAFISRWMPNPIASTLSTAQRQSMWGRYASLSGAVIGVTVGCALGATTLFFVDLEARDRIQRASQLKDVLKDMTQQAADFPCNEVVVHVAVKADQQFDWQSLNQGSASQSETSVQVDMKSLDLAQPSGERDLAVKAARQKSVIVDGQRIFAPIMQWEENEHNEIWAVVEFEKNDGKDVSESEVKTVETMASHLAVFMRRIAD